VAREPLVVVVVAPAIPFAPVPAESFEFVVSAISTFRPRRGGIPRPASFTL
jgi:hypothetical protein